MMAVLLLIGQKLEVPGVIDDLLDVENNPRKPQYRCVAIIICRRLSSMRHDWLSVNSPTLLCSANGMFVTTDYNDAQLSVKYSSRQFSATVLLM